MSVCVFTIKIHNSVQYWINWAYFWWHYSTQNSTQTNSKELLNVGSLIHLDTTSCYKTENGDNSTSLFPNWVVTPIWMVTYFTLFFLFIIFCKVVKYMHISNYPEPSSLCSGEVKRHSLPLKMTQVWILDWY